MVKVVLTVTPINQMIAMDLTKWALKAIDKLRRRSLWKGKEKLIVFSAWFLGNEPMSKQSDSIWCLGHIEFRDTRLGPPDEMAMAQKNESGRSWAGLQIQIYPSARTMFVMVMITIVGDGRHTKPWSDRWLIITLWASSCCS